MSFRDLAAALPLASLMGLRSSAAAPRADETLPDGPPPANRFAHLAGLPAAGPVAEAEPDPADPDKEEEEKEAEPEAPPAMEAEPEAAAPAEPEAEDADGAEAEEEDSAEEMNGSGPAAAARRRERARCAAIFADPAAATAPELAAHLAFETAMPRAAAIATLHAGLGALSARKAGLHSRMQAVPAVQVGDQPPGAAAPDTPAQQARASAASGLDRLRKLGMNV